MAGQPRRRAIVAELEKRTRKFFEDQDSTHLDYVVAWQAGGKTLLRLTREIEKAAGLEDLNPSQITRYLKAEFGNDIVDAALAGARREGAHALVDLNAEDAEELIPKEFAASHKTKLDTRFWIAEKWNRDSYGVVKAVNHNLSLGGMHLESLRRRSISATARVDEGDQQAHARESVDASHALPAIASAIAEDADVVSIEPATT